MADALKEFRYNAFRSVRNHQADSFNAPVFFHDLPGEIASPQYTFVLSGPPLADMAIANPDSLTPLGLIQDFNFSAARAIQPISEFGAQRQRAFKGRFTYTANLSRILSYSGNLIGMLYRWALINKDAAFAYGANERQSVHPALAAENNNRSLHAVNLNSDLMELPLGLYLVEITERGEFISGTYWEGVDVAQWNKTGSGANPVILEAAQMWIAQVRPMPCLLAIPRAAHSVSVDVTDDLVGLGPTLPVLNTAGDGPPVRDIPSFDESLPGVPNANPFL